MAEKLAHLAGVSRSIGAGTRAAKHPASRPRDAAQVADPNCRCSAAQRNAGAQIAPLAGAKAYI